MNKRLVVVASLVVLVIASCKKNPSEPPNPPVSSDTIALWKFDGNLSDASGNGHDGTDAGYFPGRPITYGPDRFGNANSAIVLQGQSAVVVADKSDLDFTGGDSFTISAWVQTTDSTFWDVVAKGPEDRSEPGYQLGMRGYSGGSIWADITSSNTGAEWSYTAATNKPNIELCDGKWHMVTLTVTAHSGASLYTDSVLEATLSDPGLQPNLHNTASLLIGSDPMRTERFEGSIDEVLIQHHALTISEVASRFHEGGWYSYPTAVDSVINVDTGSAFRWSNPSPMPSGILGMTWINGGAIGFACGKQGVIYETNDSGMTWQKLTQTVTQSDLYAIKFYSGKPTLGYAVGFKDGGVIIETIDGGKTWVRGPLPPGVATLRDLSHGIQNSGVSYAVGSDSSGHGVILYTNSALWPQPWTIVRRTPKPLYAISNTQGDLDINHPLFAVGDGGQIFAATNTQINPDSSGWVDNSTGNQNLRAVSVAGDYPGFNQSFRGVAETDNGFTLWTTDGVTWTEHSENVSGYQPQAAVYAAGGAEAWISGSHISRTTNNGLNWRIADPAAEQTWTCITPRDANDIAFLGGDKLYWLRR